MYVLGFLIVNIYSMKCRKLTIAIDINHFYIKWIDWTDFHSIAEQEREYESTTLHT